MKQKAPGNPISLFKWIWQSYLRTAIIPLIMVELVFIGIYFVSNNWSQKEMVDLLRAEVQKELQHIAGRESVVIQQQINGVSNTTEMFARQMKKALAAPASISPEDAGRMTYSPEGVYYTRRDRKDGGAAVFYSGAVPVGAAERDKVGRVLTLQRLMKDIEQSNPLIESLYLNTFDSLNIIYPYFDVISQYPPLMDIPAYNFYYEADARHNPERRVKWTDAYLDPAGHGWMASAIAPVYSGDFLEGVVGIDVTINTITNQILNLDIPWQGYGILIGKDGTILALPEKGEEDWGLNELTDHHYSEAIMKDTFKPDQFNLYKRKDLASLSGQIAGGDNGFSGIRLNGEPQVASWATVPETGWKLLIIVSEKNIYAKVDQMKNKLFRIGFFMIAGLIFFYCIFFCILYWKSRRMSYDISRPLIEINNIVQRIGAGDYCQKEPDLHVKELRETASNLVDMGQQLGAANEKLLEAQTILKAAKEEAEKASMAKSKFLSSMSHELRTPLNTVLGFARLLEVDSSAPLNESQGENVKEILKAGSHLLVLINEVLDLARVESGKLTLSIEPVQVKSVVDETLALIKPIADKTNIDVVCHLPDCGERFVAADRTRLKQVLLNLLSNAVKYNRDHGKVIVSCEKIDQDIRFNIIDKGYGIPESELSAVFEPFHRLTEANSTVEGTGIGLTVAKQLIELMGGSIGVESREGEGSHFWIDLPSLEGTRRPEDERSSYAGEWDNEAGSTLKSILYVEDNPSNLALVERVLSRCPVIKMFAAANGELGIDLARACRPDLILLDINLPGIDGYEVQRRLRECDETRGIPVIAISAGAMAKDIEKGMSAGFAEYITKPIDIHKFLGTITKYLKQN